MNRIRRKEKPITEREFIAKASGFKCAHCGKPKKLDEYDSQCTKCHRFGSEVIWKDDRQTFQTDDRHAPPI